MKAQQLLNDYLSGGISGEELRTLLAKDERPEARQVLEILNMDDVGRKTLGQFNSPPGVAERLAEKVAAVETWIEAKTQVQKCSPSRDWFPTLVTSVDVVGHSQSEKAKKRPKKSKAIKNALKKKVSIPLQK